MSSFNGKQWVQFAKNQNQTPVRKNKDRVNNKNTPISNDPLGTEPLGTETYGDKPYIKCYDCFYAAHCDVHSNRRRH